MSRIVALFGSFHLEKIMGLDMYAYKAKKEQVAGARVNPQYLTVDGTVIDEVKRTATVKVDRLFSWVSIESKIDPEGLQCEIQFILSWIFNWRMT